MQFQLAYDFKYHVEQNEIIGFEDLGYQILTIRRDLRLRIDIFC